MKVLLFGPLIVRFWYYAEVGRFRVISPLCATKQTSTSAAVQLLCALFRLWMLAGVSLPCELGDIRFRLWCRPLNVFQRDILPEQQHNLIERHPVLVLVGSLDLVFHKIERAAGR
jgi:hypothetical protein